MTDLRENLGWLVGSVATAIGVAISWLVSSEIFITLVAVLVGFLASYFLQTKTQKRAWKREYSVKVVETVYSFLFKATTQIIPSLEKKCHRRISFGEWETMQEDHRYFMVDEKFRTKLDDFLKRLENYSNAVYELRTENLPKIMDEEGVKIFKTHTEGINLRIKYKDANRVISTSPQIIDCLISQIHPKDYALKDASQESEILEFQIRFGHAPADIVGKFDEFWESCLKKMTEDETYKFIIKENDKLLEEARNMKKEIAKRIEKPWKI